MAFSRRFSLTASLGATLLGLLAAAVLINSPGRVANTA